MCSKCQRKKNQIKSNQIKSKANSLLAEQGVFSVKMMPGTVELAFASVLYSHFDSISIMAHAQLHIERKDFWHPTLKGKNTSQIWNHIEALFIELYYKSIILLRLLLSAL